MQASKKMEHILTATKLCTAACLCSFYNMKSNTVAHGMNLFVTIYISKFKHTKHNEDSTKLIFRCKNAYLY
jgi:hypothetical protein